MHMSRSGYYVFVRRQDRLRLSLKISHQGLFYPGRTTWGSSQFNLDGGFLFAPMTKSSSAYNNQNAVTMEWEGGAIYKHGLRYSQMSRIPAMEKVQLLLSPAVFGLPFGGR